MTSLQEVAAISLKHDERDYLGLSLLDDEVVFGSLYFANSRECWGLIPVDLRSSTLGELLPLPVTEIGMGLDGYASAVGRVGDSLVVFAGEASAYAPERGMVAIHGREKEDWRVFRRDESWAPVVGGYARGSSHAINVNESGGQTQVELISLDSSRMVRTIPIGPLNRPQTAALAPALTHLAIAQEGSVVCLRADGSLECSWPNSRRFFAMWFAEDDLAVVGASREGFVLHQWHGGLERFEVPTMRPRGFDPKTRAALFWNVRSHEYVELDLASGRPRSSGTLPFGDWIDVDLPRRRVATWRFEDRMLRVFQML